MLFRSRSQQVEIGGERAETLVELKDLTCDTPGRFVYRCEIQPPDGEAVVAERHVKTAPVEVLGETMRLLLIAGGATSTATEEEAEEAAEAALSTVDSEFGRTTDPVRMYMREMGSVELLTREGEKIGRAHV